CMLRTSGVGAIVYSIVGCSAAHATSKPSRSAATTISSASAATLSIGTSGCRRVMLTAIENLTRPPPQLSLVPLVTSDAEVRLQRSRRHGHDHVETRRTRRSSALGPSSPLPRLHDVLGARGNREPSKERHRLLVILLLHR